MIDIELKPCAHCGMDARSLKRKDGFYSEAAICDSCNYSLPVAVWQARTAIPPAPAEPASTVDAIANFLNRYEEAVHRAMDGKVDIVGQYATLLADLRAVARMRAALFRPAPHRYDSRLAFNQYDAGQTRDVAKLKGGA